LKKAAIKVFGYALVPVQSALRTLVSASKNEMQSMEQSPEEKSEAVHPLRGVL